MRVILNDMENKNTQEEIIKFLKAKKISNMEQIAKQVGETWHSGIFKYTLESLVDHGLIKSTKPKVYMITPKGEEFESFDKLYEDKDWQIKLAKSNIEANELQKTIATKNEKKGKRNEVAMWLNIAIGIANAILLAWQLSKVV